MPTNQEIWGQSSDWTCPASTMTGTNQDMKPLVGYLGAAPSSLYPAGCLFSGIYHDVFPTINGNMFTDEPIDNSISYCGLGNESVWSRVQYYMVGPTTTQSLTASDDRSVTNFAFCESQGTASGLYQNNNTDANQKRGNRDRWSPMGYNLKELNPSAANTNSNRRVQPYVQLPIRNMILTATLRVARNLGATASQADIRNMNITNVALWDYMDTNSQVNYTTHPYILTISIQPYMVGTNGADNIDPVTGVPPAGTNRSGYNIYSGISILSPLSYADGVESDEGNPGNILHDVYSYYWSKSPTRINGIWIFGTSSVGLNDGEYIRQLSTDEVTGQLRWALPHPNAVMEAMTGTNDYGWYYLEYYDGLVEWIKQQMACFGLFFTIDKATAQTGSLIDENMFLGILEDGIGHGRYTNGEENMEQPQWEWDTTNSSSYKPHDGGGGSDDPSYPDTNPILPSTPGFTLAGKGTQCYAITYLDMNEIMEDIFGTSSTSYKELIEGLAMFGSNPMNAFISYKWYPFIFSSSSKSPIILGSTVVNDEHTYDILNGVDNTFKEFTASCSIQAENNFVNSRRSKAQLFLPFYGFYEVPMNLLMSQPISVSFRYNVPDAMGVWVISFGSKIYDFVECDPSIEVPLTGDNQREIMLAKRQAAASIASKAFVTMAAAVGGIVSAMGASDALIASMASTSTKEILGTVGKGAALGLKTGLMNAGITYAGGTAIVNTLTNSARNVGNLSVNVPSHGAADATTFLNLPLYPFIIVYTPKTIDDYNESEYKLKVGIACDKWVTASEMPSNSLLKTGGMANMSTSGMEIEEIQELNDILQTGFYK